MYLKSGEEYIDAELVNLGDLLRLLDIGFRALLESIQRSSDPESDGLLDRTEYLVGIAFCAVQQYMTDTLTFTGVEMSRALTLGPVDACGRPVVAALNAGANWWKHSAEWWARGSVPPIGMRTADLVGNVTDGNVDYPLSIILGNSLDSKGLSNLMLIGLIPTLTSWRGDVDTMSGKLKLNTPA